MDITIDLSWWALLVLLIDIVIRVIAIISSEYGSAELKTATPSA